MGQKLYLIVDKKNHEVVAIAPTRAWARNLRIAQLEKIVELPLTPQQVQLIAKATN